MVLPDADPLHEDNVRPVDRNGQAIPTHQTTSPKATMTRSVGLFSDNLGSWPYLVKLRARAPQRGQWKALLSGTMRFFLPSSGQKNGARPPNHPVSPKLAKSPDNFESYTWDRSTGNPERMARIIVSRIAPSYYARNTLKRLAIMRVLWSIRIICRWRKVQSIFVMKSRKENWPSRQNFYVNQYLIGMKPCGPAGADYACHTLAIVSARILCVPRVASTALAASSNASFFAENSVLTRVYWS
jgi:hypothetical protein